MDGGRASLATDTVIVYFRNVVQAFKARFTQLGGKIAAEETYQSLGGNPASWQSTVTRLNGEDADVIVTVTAAAFSDRLPTFVSGIRSLGNKTPIFNSWGGDGNYWWTKEPQVTNYYDVRPRRVRRRPEPGGERAGQGGHRANGGKLPAHRELRAGRGRGGCDRRGGQEERRLHERRSAGGADREVQDGCRRPPGGERPKRQHTACGASSASSACKNSEAKVVGP